MPRDVYFLSGPSCCLYFVFVFEFVAFYELFRLILWVLERRFVFVAATFFEIVYAKHYEMLNVSFYGAIRFH